MARHTTGTRTQLKTFSRRDIAVWQQESPSLQGGEDVKATLNNSARHCEADSIYQNYCFGDGVQVAGQDGWEYTTPGDVWLFFWQSEANNLGVGLFTTALCR